MIFTHPFLLLGLRSVWWNAFQIWLLMDCNDFPPRPGLDFFLWKRLLRCLKGILLQGILWYIVMIAIKFLINSFLYFYGLIVSIVVFKNALVLVSSFVQVIVRLTARTKEHHSLVRTILTFLFFSVEYIIFKQMGAHCSIKRKSLIKYQFQCIIFSVLWYNYSVFLIQYGREMLICWAPMVWHSALKLVFIEILLLRREYDHAWLKQFISNWISYHFNVLLIILAVYFCKHDIVYLIPSWVFWKRCLVCFVNTFSASDELNIKEIFVMAECYFV